MGSSSDAVLRRRNSHEPDIQRISGLNFMVGVNAPARGRGLRRDQNPQQTVAVAFGAGVVDRDSRPLRPDRIWIVVLPPVGNARVDWVSLAILQRGRPYNSGSSYPGRSCSYTSPVSEAHGLHQLQIESFARVDVNVLAFHYQHGGQPGRRARPAPGQYACPG